MQALTRMIRPPALVFSASFTSWMVILMRTPLRWPVVATRKPPSSPKKVFRSSLFPGSCSRSTITSIPKLLLTPQRCSPHHKDLVDQLQFEKQEGGSFYSIYLHASPTTVQSCSGTKQKLWQCMTYVHPTYRPNNCSDTRLTECCTDVRRCLLYKIGMLFGLDKIFWN